ncbi:MAG: hypothetical protein F6K55_37845 [Moorea sp. SIO4A3]|nr:hypothetical protein [Moorena sp. SIO4A3]
MQRIAIPYYLLSVPCSRLDAKREWGGAACGTCVRSLKAPWKPPRPRCIAVPCSLKSRNCVPHSYDNCYNMN